MELDPELPELESPPDVDADGRTPAAVTNPTTLPVTAPSPVVHGPAGTYQPAAPRGTSANRSAKRCVHGNARPRAAA